MTDSPDNQDRILQEVYRYNWSTEVYPTGDGKGDFAWHLVPYKAYKRFDIYPIPYAQMEEPKLLFNKLLRAFYSRPYEITVLSDVINLVAVANAYGCLPVLSYSLNAAMLSIKDAKALYFSIHVDLTAALAVAKRLRNSTLYRDAMVFAVADVKNPAYLRAHRDTFPFKEARNAYNRIDFAFGTFFEKFMIDHKNGDLMAHSNDIETGGLFDYCARLAKDSVTGELILLRLLRVIHETVWQEDAWAEDLQKLLECKLTLSVSDDDFVAGEGGFEGMFLCATVHDDELHWDNAVDW